MAKRRAKTRKGSSKGAIHKVGKITFLYFSGDVGEFLDALSSKLKDPKVAESLAEAISVASAGAQAAGARSRTILDGEPS